MTERHEELLELLQSVNRSTFDIIKDILVRHGLPHAAMAIMHHIRLEEGITLSELARRTSIVKSHVSKTVESLVEQGMVEKRPDPADQRLIRLHSTAKSRSQFGPTAHQGVHLEVRQRLAGVIANLPDDKLEALTDGLRSLKAILDQHLSRPPAKPTTGDERP